MVALSTEKGKEKKTPSELWEALEKELEEEGPKKIRGGETFKDEECDY